MSSESEPSIRSALSRPSMWQWLGALLASGGLIAALVGYVGARRLAALLRQIHPRPMFVACLAYTGVLVTRWLRLAGVWSDQFGQLQLDPALLWTTTGHSFANHLMPFRSGELAFPLLLRRADDRPFAEGMLLLTAIRFIELGCLVPIYGIALLVWWSGDSTANGFRWSLYVAMGGAIVLIATLPTLLETGLDLASRLLESRLILERAWVSSLLDYIDEARSALERIGSSGMLWLAATSTLMWCLMFVVFDATLAAFGAELGWAQTIVGSGGGLVGNLVPGGVGSLGTMEAGWLAAFQATGAPRDPVVAAGLAVHALVISGTGLATLIGWLLDEVIPLPT